MSKNKVVLIVIILVILIGLICGIVAYKVSHNNHDEDDNSLIQDNNLSRISVTPEEKIKIGRVIENMNLLNKIFISEEFDRSEFITDEYGEKYYKYTGNDLSDMISLLNAVYLYGMNNAYFKVQNGELYVFLPEKCNRVVELAVPDVNFDINDYQDGYIDLIIESKDKSIDFSTTFVKNEKNQYKVSSLINPCIE